MKKRVAHLIVAMICLAALAACSGQASPALTVTPGPTGTPTPASGADVSLGARQRVDAGGFSFQAPQGFAVQVHAAQATIRNTDDTIVIAFAMTPRKDSSQTADKELVAFMAKVSNFVDAFKAGTPRTASVGQLPGLGVNVTGSLFGVKNTGQILLVDTGKAGFFTAFAFVVDGANGNRWETGGRQVVDAIVNSIEFFEPVGSQ